jgi:peptide/nickel transport system permease protein
MKLWEYVVRRLIALLPVIIGVTVIAFVLWKAIPIDPAIAYLGPKAKPEQIAAFHAEWHLNDPLPNQYFYYMGRLLTGNLGPSFVNHVPVTEDLATYLPATLELTITAMLFALPVGIYLGIKSAANPNKWVDLVSRFIAIIGVAIPIYWLAIMLKIFFHEDLGVIGMNDLLPLDGRLGATMTPPPTVTGFYTIDSLLALNYPDFVSAVTHLILPAFTLGFAQLAIILRMTRSGMIEVLGQDYIRTARAKGVPERQVVFRHAFRNAMNATLTVAGLTVGSAFAGDVYVESIFNWPGIGKYFLQAALHAGFTDLLGYLFVVTVFYVSVNLVVDVLYATVDPHVTLGGA